MPSDAVGYPLGKWAWGGVWVGCEGLICNGCAFQQGLAFPSQQDLRETIAVSQAGLVWGRVRAGRILVAGQSILLSRKAPPMQRTSRSPEGWGGISRWRQPPDPHPKRHPLWRGGGRADARIARDRGCRLAGRSCSGTPAGAQPRWACIPVADTTG